MYRSLRQALTAVHQDEAGQAFVEYFAVVFTVAIAVGASFRLFDRAVSAYYSRAVQWITLPVP